MGGKKEMNDDMIIKVPKMTEIDAILEIENTLMKTDLSWSISYNPSTKSYLVFIAEDVDEDE